MRWLERRREVRRMEEQARLAAFAERKRRLLRGELDYSEMQYHEIRGRLRQVWADAGERMSGLAQKLDLPREAIERAIYGDAGWPRVPWEELETEKLVELERQMLEPLLQFERSVARGRHRVRVTDWRTAEEVAAHWMRQNGWPDARVTGTGKDVGADVVAKGAVAQVKWFGAARVGRPTIQRVRGAARPRGAALFFACAEAGSGKPYTREAREWASANRVRLFVIDAFGRVREIERP